jgi:hypothetical protein
MNAPRRNIGEVEDIIASLMHQEAGARKARRKLFRRKPTANNKTTESQWRQFDNTGQLNGNTYSRAMFGPERSSHFRQSKSNRRTVAVQVPPVDIRNILKRGRSKQWLVYSGIFIVVVVLPILALNIARRDKPAPPTPTGEIAPSKVFTPLQLPEGYDISGETQSLENGALIYTVFDPEGRIITISQQAKPHNFDKALFEDAIKFTTDKGEAYIISDGKRTNGYLLTETTWVMFNAPEGVTIESVRSLIRSY